MYQDVTPIIN